MTNHDFAALDRILAADGASAALENLADGLRSAGDATGYFYALLMKDRQRLGIAPTPTRPSQELPDHVHEEYEAAIRVAGRTAGQMCLDRGNILHAWGFFRMLGEPGPVREALDAYQPAEDEELAPLLDIALQQSVNPRRGLDLVLARQGICSAISAVGAFGQGMAPEDRAYCAGRLVRALHEQLAFVLRGAIEANEGTAPSESAGIGELIADRDWLFGDDCYYVDLSHLASVVQLSLELPPGAELEMARGLCAFGARLPERFAFHGPPPFAGYADFGACLAIHAGDQIEEHLRRFRQYAEEAEPGVTEPAEMLVNLLVKCGRLPEALAAAQHFLLHADERQLNCPGVYELAYRLRDFEAMAAAAQQRGDGVHYLAARLETRRESKN